jgi:hypothetical protein
VKNLRSARTLEAVELMDPLLEDVLVSLAAAGW